MFRTQRRRWGKWGEGGLGLRRVVEPHTPLPLLLRPPSPFILLSRARISPFTVRRRLLSLRFSTACLFSASSFYLECQVWLSILVVADVREPFYVVQSEGRPASWRLLGRREGNRRLGSDGQTSFRQVSKIADVDSATFRYINIYTHARNIYLSKMKRQALSIQAASSRRNASKHG